MHAARSPGPDGRLSRSEKTGLFALGLVAGMIAGGLLGHAMAGDGKRTIRGWSEPPCRGACATPASHSLTQ